jgi:hypothetical protein
VSFHQPSSISTRTVLPRSISHWMASRSRNAAPAGRQGGARLEDRVVEE